MWWRERWQRQHWILHMGRQHVTAWPLDKGPKKHLVERRPLAGCSLAQLAGLNEVLASITQAVPGKVAWTALLDSCWLPITTIDAHANAWSLSEVKSLARHRWADLYGHQPGDWLAQSTYLPGDADATVYGIPRSLQQALLSAPIVAIEPACVWAWRSTMPPKNNQAQQVIWAEQDRCICMQAQGQHLKLVDPAMQTPRSLAELMAKQINGEDDTHGGIWLGSVQAPEWAQTSVAARERAALTSRWLLNEDAQHSGGNP